ncbi:MAG: threonine-phosphate decarboxylase, partial [Firmicutes bacterium]|nr:threonine-phosphate decarboxylase [Bacillota bacterium]
MRNYEHGGDIFAGKEKLTDFSVNIDPLGMPASAAEAAQRAVREEITYPDPFCRKLTAALSERYGVPKEHIVCGNGASDLMTRLCCWLEPLRALVPAPGFSEYRRCCE